MVADHNLCLMIQSSLSAELQFWQDSVKNLVGKEKAGWRSL